MDHQSRSDICCDQPPSLDYHLDSNYQKSSDLCYNQSLGHTTRECSQPGDHLKDHQIFPLIHNVIRWTVFYIIQSDF